MKNLKKKINLELAKIEPYKARRGIIKQRFVDTIGGVLSLYTFI